MVRLADCGPIAVGLKTRETFSESPGTSTWPEILPVEIEKRALSMERLPMDRLAVPVLLTVTLWVALVELISTEPKSMDKGETEISGRLPAGRTIVEAMAVL